MSEIHRYEARANPVPFFQPLASRRLVRVAFRSGAGEGGVREYEKRRCKRGREGEKDDVSCSWRLVSLSWPSLFFLFPSEHSTLLQVFFLVFLGQRLPAVLRPLESYCQECREPLKPGERKRGREGGKIRKEKRKPR